MLHRARSLSRRQEQPPQWEGAASQQLSETRPGLFFFQFVGMWVDFSPFFSSLLLSAVSTEMWEFANLSQWKGEERLISGVLVRDQGCRKGHCNSGSKKTRNHSLMVLLGKGRLSLSPFLLRLQGCLLTSAKFLALKSIPPGDCKNLSAFFFALQCQMSFPQGPGQTVDTPETLLPRDCSPSQYLLEDREWETEEFCFFPTYTFKRYKIQYL